jgi:hypothetical protein
MRSFIGCLIIFASLPIEAQTPGELATAHELQQVLEQKSQELKAFKAREKLMQEHQQSLSKQREEIEKLGENLLNHAQNRDRLGSEVNQMLQGLPLPMKISRKASFLKCVKNSLQQQHKTSVEACRKSYPAIFSATEEKKLALWKTLEKNPAELEARKKQLKLEIPKIESTLVNLEKFQQYSRTRLDQLKIQEQQTSIRLNEYKRLKELPGLQGCGPHTSTINLELEKPYPEASFKGPFHGIARDNQDGLGTCYANTAKNLLLGVTGGEVNASFLDAALLYKISSGDLHLNALDGGGSCATLEEIKKVGYCPQSQSPLERGERNLVFESLMGETTSLWSAVSTINLLKNFLAGKEEFDLKTSPLHKDLYNKAHEIITKLQQDPSIKLPLPGARVAIPPLFHLKKYVEQNRFKLKIKEDEFLDSYQKTYKTFFPKYVRALQEDKKPDEIFALYEKHFDEFITTHQMRGALDEFKQAWLPEVQADLYSPQFKSQLRSSFDFLKEIMGQSNQTDEAALNYCMANFFDGLNFLASFQPLMDKLKELKVDPKLLFNEEGKFRSSQELMQLAIAPGCLHPANREPVKTNFTCQNGHDTINQIHAMNLSEDQKLDVLRERIVLSLMNGYPLGNSTAQLGGHHINTIAGLRYNPELKRCEYLIRESQTGTSDWHDERSIFNKIRALTEVRKQ